MNLTAKKLLVSDHVLLLCLLGPLILWGMFAWEAWSNKAPASPAEASEQSRHTAGLLWAAVGATVVFPIIGALRFRYMRHILAGAVTVTGKVVSFGMKTQGWVRLNYKYVFGGKTHAGAASIHETSVSSYREGGPIELLVPPSHPSRSYIKAEYT